MYSSIVRVICVKSRPRFPPFVYKIVFGNRGLLSVATRFSRVQSDVTKVCFVYLYQVV